MGRNRTKRGKAGRTPRSPYFDVAFEARLEAHWFAAFARSAGMGDFCFEDLMRVATEAHGGLSLIIGLFVPNEHPDLFRAALDGDVQTVKAIMGMYYESVASQKGFEEAWIKLFKMLEMLGVKETSIELIPERLQQAVREGDSCAAVVIDVIEREIQEATGRARRECEAAIEHSEEGRITVTLGGERYSVRDSDRIVELVREFVGVIVESRAMARAAERILSDDSVRMVLALLALAEPLPLPSSS